MYRFKLLHIRAKKNIAHNQVPSLIEAIKCKKTTTFKRKRKKKWNGDFKTRTLVHERTFQALYNRADTHVKKWLAKELNSGREAKLTLDTYKKIPFN